MDWFVRFAWLIHDSKNHVFHCKVCVHAKAKNVFVTRKDCAKPKKIWQNTRYLPTTGDRRYCRSARDRWTRSLRTITRSLRLSPICGPRRHKRSIVSQQLRTLSYEEAFKICTVKEQRPGFTGLVKQVDTVAETRVVVGLYHGDILSVGDLQCVLDFLVLYL